MRGFLVLHPSFTLLGRLTEDQNSSHVWSGFQSAEDDQKGFLSAQASEMRGIKFIFHGAEFV
jgi:hypothetical protein